jgi:hypothetical protein
MANDVVAWGEFGWQYGRDLELVRDEFICDPSSWAEDSRLGDLGPAKSTWCQSSAVT